MLVGTVLVAAPAIKGMKLGSLYDYILGEMLSYPLHWQHLVQLQFILQGTLGLYS